jgi:cytochrome c553
VHPSKQIARARRLRPALLITCLAGAAIGLAPAALFAQDGSPQAGQQKSTTCAACHGADGNSVAQPEWPSLAGQHAKYIERQLEAFKSGQRPDVLGMQGLAGALSEADMADIAAYFSSQTMAVKGTDPALVDRGQRIYRGGIPERSVPACIACHGPTGTGNPLAGYPRISHQHDAYLAKTLRDYRAGTRRSDSDMNQMMRNVAELLLDDEIDALASYMQGLE